MTTPIKIFDDVAIKEREATCGACGSEKPVTPFMKRDRDQQFRARPEEPTDSFYCGCQSHDEEWGDPP